MSALPLPAGVADEHRLAAVRVSQLLDSDAEEPFDRLTRLAATVLEAPFAFVTIVDDERSYWKSCVGVDLDALGAREMGIRDSFCQHAIGLGAPFVVDDTRRDARTRDLPPVTELGIGAWASAPVMSPAGETLGTLCVGDVEARVWTDRDIGVLETLAHAVTGEIGLREESARASAMAAMLQDSLLPAEPPQVPGFELAAAYEPAGDGGGLVGDFYDVYPGAGGVWHVVLGDVCGHGVEAARAAALARYTVRAGAAGPADEAFARVNETLIGRRAAGDDRHVTAVLLTVTPDGEQASVVVAGHPPALVRRADGTVERLERFGDLLGAFPDADWSRHEFALAPGDTIVLYTDGVIEAGSRGMRLGETGLEALLRDAPVDEPVAELVARIQQVTHAFAGRVLADDAATIVLRRR